MSALEHRYRRLLGLYPRDYRERYEQEMLGVLLDGAEQGRNRPTRREAVDLVRGAVAYRARIAVADLRASQWRRTAGLVAVVAVAAAAALSLSDLLTVVGPWLGHGYLDSLPVGPSAWVPPLVWCLALPATLAGRRRVAVGLAGLGLLFDAGVVALQYHRSFDLANPSLWRLALAMVAVLGLVWTRDLRDGLRLLGWRRGVGVAALLAWHTVARYVLAAAAPLLPDRLVSAAHSAPIPIWVIWGPGSALLVVLVLTVLLIGLEAPVRRRLLAVVAAVGLAGLLEVFLGGFYPGVPHISASLQVTVALVVTALTFALAAAAIHRRERASQHVQTS
jgi:hypothetical protein